MATMDSNPKLLLIKRKNFFWRLSILTYLKISFNVCFIKLHIRPWERVSQVHIGWGEMEGRLNNPFLHKSTKNAAVFWLEIVDIINNINILFFIITTIITSICSIILFHMYQSDLDKVRNTEPPLSSQKSLIKNSQCASWIEYLIILMQI